MMVATRRMVEYARSVKLMAPFAAVTVVLLLAVVLPSVASAQGPFVPGQVRSQALAESVWHPPCAHIGISPLNPTDLVGSGRTSDDVFGIAFPGQCRLELNGDAIKQEGRDEFQGHFRPGVRQREVKIWACTVIVHEYGHLAGYYDPVGFTEDDGTVDHSHSPDVHNVMYGILNYTYLPCRKLFPAPRSARR